MRRTGILTIKPIDDLGRVDDEKERHASFDWDGTDYENLSESIGGFVIFSVKEITEQVLAEEAESYAASLPAFDLTLEMQEKL